MKRRHFMSWMGGALGLSVFFKGRALWAKKLGVPLKKVPGLEKVGGSALVPLKGNRVLFVRDGRESVKALNPVCTHAQCLVSYDAAQKRLVCPCHLSQFSLEGKVLGGPASEPLPTYEARLDGDRIIIDLGDSQ